MVSVVEELMTMGKMADRHPLKGGRRTTGQELDRSCSPPSWSLPSCPPYPPIAGESSLPSLFVKSPYSDALQAPHTPLSQVLQWEVLLKYLDHQVPPVPPAVLAGFSVTTESSALSGSEAGKEEGGGDGGE